MIEPLDKRFGIPVMRVGTFGYFFLTVRETVTVRIGVTPVIIEVIVNINIMFGKPCLRQISEYIVDQFNDKLVKIGLGNIIYQVKQGLVFRTLPDINKRD